jgi:50S ribosomal subunit-associated GTPase HflX
LLLHVVDISHPEFEDHIASDKREASNYGFKKLMPIYLTIDDI